MNPTGSESSNLPGAYSIHGVVRALESALDRSDREAVGTRVGPYKLIQKIGEGGFGVVWMADQLEPIRRRVALKIVKVGMDTDEVIARFEVERQALALMDHPNIARVFDAGATAAGRPFFVMELVRGVAITRYCDDNRLTPEARLRLFISVCQAVQHAHQKGIIHRDLKPSNILVTLHDGVPVPKVIDFGIAKATAKQLTEKTLVTQFHAFVGTPAYTSPEQMEMSALDVDTRSDIYSLGVLLYELLAGRPPFDPDALIKSGIDAMRRTIREVDPPRPSNKLRTLTDEDRTSVAGQRGTDVTKLSLLLRGDLDWIAMRCLEKDRTRRYETANALARDVERHLANEPVSARPPSLLYRAQKFTRRNRLVVAAAGAITVSLFGALALSTWSLLRERAAREHAVAAEKSAIANRQRSETARQLAEQARARAEAQAYAADMNLVQQSLERDNLGRARDLLNRYRPAPNLASTSQNASFDPRGWEWRYLWQLCRSDASFSFCEGRSPITSVAVSHDGSWIAQGSEQTGDLSLWNVSTREEIQLPAGQGEVLVAFSPKEPLLAFAITTRDQSNAVHQVVRLWNGTTRQVYVEIPLPKTCIGLAFAGDGKTLATLTLAGELSLWRVADGSKQLSYPTAGAFRDSPRGRHTFSISRDLTKVAYAKEGPDLNTGVTCLVDLTTGTTRELRHTGGQLRAVAFSPDGKILAIAEYRTIRLRDAESGADLAQLQGNRNQIHEIAFSPDGKSLASAGADQTISVWQLADLRNVPPPRIFRGHQLEVLCVAFLPDGLRFVSGGKEGSLCLWNTANPAPVRGGASQVRGNFIDWCFAADSQSLLTVDKDGAVVRWRGADFQERQPLLELGANAIATRFSRNARLLAVGTPEGGLQIWDLERGAKSRQLTLPWNNISPLEFLAEGKRIVVRGEANRLHEWDLEAGREIRSWDVPATASAIAFTDDGNRCLMVGAGKSASSLRDLLSGHEIALFLNIESRVNGAAFSPSGQYYAAAMNQGYAILGETARPGQPPAKLNPFTVACTTVAFSPDSRRLAIGTPNGTEGIKLWDTAIGRELFAVRSAPGVAGNMRQVAFSPDGNLIACIREITGIPRLDVWRAPSLAEIERVERNERR